MLRLHVFNTGWISLQEKRLYLGGGPSMRILPVLAFVVEHPRGLVVFDTGLNAAFATRSGRYAGRLAPLLHPFRSMPGMNLATQMRRHGLEPEDVQCVVLSHLHYDHTGDLRAFPQARLLLTRREWQAGRSLFRRWRGYRPQEYEDLALTPLEFPSYDEFASKSALEGKYGLDLLEDGSLVLVPTFGHTVGHQSLLVFLPGGVALLAGDAAYTRENYAIPAAQPYPHSSQSAWRSLIGLRALFKGDASAMIVPAHDASMLQGVHRPDVVFDSELITPPAASATILP